MKTNKIKTNHSEKLTEKDLDNIYNSSWLAKKYIDKTTSDMLKEPRVFVGDYDNEALAQALEC